MFDRKHNENNPDENIFPTLESPDRPLAVLERNPENAIDLQRTKTHCIQHSGGRITFENRLRNTSDSHAKRLASSLDPIVKSIYFEVDSIGKRLEALSATEEKAGEGREEGRTVGDVHETLGVPHVSIGIDDLFIEGDRLMAMGTTVI